MPRIRKFPYLTPSRLPADHRDYELLCKLESAIYQHAGGKEKFEANIPVLFRQAIDEVIDPARSGRFLLEELQNSEKTYIGTKIEIILRNHLKLDRGIRLDVVIAGTEVDIKNTTGNSWMIPREAIGHPCILLRTDEKAARCWFGLVIAHQDVLNPGGNQDQKTTIAAAHFINVMWMLYAHPYPRNFWEDVTASYRHELMKMKSGNTRVISFFKHYIGIPISRDVLLALAPQKDTLKRLRKNGGARDKLSAAGIALLSGKYHSSLIAALRLPFCDPHQFISVIPRNPEELALLQSEGLLPALNSRVSNGPSPPNIV